MDQMEDLQFLQAKLSEIQKELNAPKNLRNEFGKYNYRNAEGILEAVKPHLAKGMYIRTDAEFVNGICVVTAYLIYGLASVQSKSYAREAEEKKGMDVAQISGAAYSYAKKYALGGLFAIDDSKDDPDTKDNSEQSKAFKYKGNYTVEKEIASMKAVKGRGLNVPTANNAPAVTFCDEVAELSELGVDFELLCDYYDVSNVTDLTKNQLIHALEMKRKGDADAKKKAVSH